MSVRDTQTGCARPVAAGFEWTRLLAGPAPFFMGRQQYDSVTLLWNAELFLRLFREVAISNRIDGWRVCWIAADMLKVFALVVACRQYPDTLGYGKQFQAIICAWRPGFVRE